MATSSIPLMPLNKIVPGGKCKLLMSFGGRDAFHFVCWLRLALYQHYGFSKTNHIYLDTYGLLGLKGTKLSLSLTHADGQFERGALTFDQGGNLTGVASNSYTSLDKLPAARGGSVGTMNDDWNKIYVDSMSHARVMLFVVTPAWLASEFCGQEFSQYVSMNNAKGTPAVVVTFRDDPASRRTFEQTYMHGAGKNFASTMRMLTLERQYAVSGRVRSTLSPNMRDLYMLTESSFKELINWMPPLRSAKDS